MEMTATECKEHSLYEAVHLKPMTSKSGHKSNPEVKGCKTTNCRQMGTFIHSQ